MTKPRAQSSTTTSKGGKKRKADDMSNEESNESLSRNLKHVKLNYSPSSSSTADNKDFITYSFLQTASYEAKDCGGQGNCLYLSISDQLDKNNNNSASELRRKACDYIYEHLDHFESSLKGLLNEQTNKPYTALEYIKEKRKNGEFADEPEILALSKVLNRTIRVYVSFYTNGKRAGFTIRSEYSVTHPNGLILLHFIPDLYAPHYQAIKPINLESFDTNSVTPNHQNSDSTETNQNLENPASTSSLNVNTITKRNLRQVYGLMAANNDRYNEVLNFFESGTDQKLPDHLKNAKSRSAWKSKTIEKYKYEGNLKRIMELKSVSYESLSSLFPKPEFESEKHSYNCWFYIPLECEKNQILQKAHNDAMHLGRDRMMNSIRVMGYNWYGLTHDCTNYIANCAVCPVTTLQKMPSVTTKQILEETPRARYQMDTVFLAEELQTDNIKYLITIEDHFSKFLWVATSLTKEAGPVEIALKTFFSLFGLPKKVQCDNGKEFLNTTVETYLKNLNIKFDHGRPYHPQSQGLIERVNRTIQTALVRIYTAQKNKFNLQSSLIDVVTQYNNTTHTSTKMAPKAAFALDPTNEKDKPLLKWVKDNMVQSFKNKITKIKYLVDQKVLLFNAVTKGKDNYLRKSTSKKKTLKAYIIPAIVTLVEESYVVIKIIQSSKIIGGDILKPEEEYKITLNLIQKCNDKRWKSYLEKK